MTKTRLIGQTLGLLLAVAAAWSLNSAPQSEPATSDLDRRLDGLIGQMSTREKIEQLFYQTDGNARLGIPQFTGSDGPHGIGNKAKGWSSFPVTIAMAATWDRDMVRRVGRAIALEQASRGRHRIAGPTLDLLNDPRIGRAPETIGEDPFLGGRISEGFLHGMNETAVFGTIKHYNMNTYEAGREKNNYLIDTRSLVEFWGEHWRRAVQDGGALSVMCAYNLVNGQKCAENYELIKVILRDRWGFSGYTMSDWGGFASTEKAIAAELDFCEGNELYIKKLPGLVEAGRVTIPQLDHAVRNVLRTKLLSGMIDGQPAVALETRDCAEHRELVYRSGVEGIVLLKNERGFLPLSTNLTSVALIGPNADNLPLDGHSSSAVIPSYTITVRQGLEKILGQERIHYAKGCEINSTNREGFTEALAIARRSDVVIFVGGLNNTVEGEEYFIKGDRLTGSVELPGVQNEVIQALARANPNLALVVISGGPCSVSRVLQDVRGLLYAFYPGQEGGRAIADLLCGRENPSGKLPVTIPMDDAQLDSFPRDFRGVVTNGVGYRRFDRLGLKPGFAFGSGLSYTTFSFKQLRVQPEIADAGQTVTVSLEVNNTGKVAGQEVVQLYLAPTQLSPALNMPVKQLRGFRKVRLAPGETMTVTLTLSADEFYAFDERRAGYFVPTGDYQVWVGGASDRLPLAGRLTLRPAKARPDLQIVNLRTVPPYPKPGDAVIFVASVVNRGTGPVPAERVARVLFSVNDKVVAGGRLAGTPLPPGGMALVSSDSGAARPSWTAREGKFEVLAEVNPDLAVDEPETNNVCRGTMVLPGGRILPQGKP